MKRFCSLLAAFILLANPVLADYYSPGATGGGGGTSGITNPFPAFTETGPRSIGLKFFSPTGTTFDSIGMASAAQSGTATNSDDANGAWLNFATSTSSGNDAGVNAAAFEVTAQESPQMVATVETGSSLTNVRIISGFSSNRGSQIGATIPTLVDFAQFRYDTSSDGTAFWRCSTGTSGGSSTTVTTTVPIVISSKYVLGLDETATQALFYINGTLVATISTNLPTSTDQMASYADVVTLTTSSKSIKVKSIWISAN